MQCKFSTQSSIRTNEKKQINLKIRKEFIFLRGRTNQNQAISLSQQKKNKIQIDPAVKKTTYFRKSNEKFLLYK